MQKMGLVKLLSLFSFIAYANIFLFHKFGSFGFGLISSGLFVLLSFLFLKRHQWSAQKIPFVTLLVFFILLLINIITRSSGFVIFIQSLFVFVTFGLLIYLLSTATPHLRSILELLLVPVNLGIAYFIGFFQSINAIFHFKPKFGQNQTQIIPGLRSMLLGLGVGLPIAFVLLILLSGADPIFGTLVKQFFAGINLGRLPAHLIFSLFLFAVLLPLAFLKLTQVFIPQIKFRISLVHEMSVVMGLVATVIGLFLLVQWQYIFVNVAFETDLSKFGVATYSEYVRRGFIELIFISLIIYCLIWAGLIIQRNHQQGRSWLQYFQIIVLAEFAVFLFSVFRRIDLYQQYHGWSLVRIYGGITLVFISFFAATLLGRHFMKKRWIIAETIFTMLLILFIGFFNSEDFIVKNHPPTVNKRIDYVYLSRMSSDGYTGWLKAYEYANNILKQDKSFYNRDDRRNLAYAGAVVSQLMENHFFLLQQVGSAAQIKSFYQTALAQLLERNKIVGDEIKQLLLQTSSLSQPNTTLETEARNLNTRISQLEESINQLNQSANDKELVLPFTIDVQNYSYPNAFSICDITVQPESLTYLNYYHSCSKTFFILRPKTYSLTKNIDQLDRLFVWNLSDQHAFQQMETKIPLTKLIDLQKAYFLQVDQVLNQPKEEQDFEVDISSRTPLLD